MLMINSFIEKIEESKGNKHTIKAYYSNLKQFYAIMEITDENMLKSFNTNDIYNYINLLKIKYSETSINQKIATLKSFYKYLLKCNFINENILQPIDFILEKQKLPQFLDLEESKKLLSIFEEDNSILGIRDKLIIQIFLDSGLRVFELEKLKIQDINFNDGETYILGKRKIERYISFSPQTLELIKKWLEVRKEIYIKDEFKEYLLISTTGKGTGENLKKRAIQYVVERNMKKANVKNVSTHKLRHSYATIMLGTGTMDEKQVQYRMGHKHKATTELYTHALETKNKVNPLFA